MKKLQVLFQVGRKSTFYKILVYRNLKKHILENIIHNQRAIIFIIINRIVIKKQMQKN